MCRLQVKDKPQIQMSCDRKLVDIHGLNKVILLRALWENSCPARFFYTSGLEAPQFDEKKAEVAVTGFVDYFGGRCIKLHIENDLIDPWLYDRDFGEGSVERIVNEIRSKKMD